MGQIVFVLLVIGGLGAFFFRHFGGGALTMKSAQESPHAVEDGGGAPVHERHDEKMQSETAEQEPDEAGLEKIDPEETDSSGPSLNARIVALVASAPGMLQTEIYASFPDENRKGLQAVLLRMDRNGTLKREREGSSYRLFVA